MTRRADHTIARVCLAVATLALASCGGVSNPDSVVSKALMGTSNPPPPIDLSKFGPTVKCPPVTVHSGTESFSVYEKGQVGAFAVRHQASIVDTASECAKSGDMLVMKIGVRGRVLAGPKSTYGAVTMPLRVAVTRDDTTVVYSKMYPITSTLSEAEPSQAWATVIDDVQVPDEGTLRILLGFDDQTADKRS